MRDRYWHNMATRIQRAWRNYLRYRTECAIRIQRFWRKINGGGEFIQLRAEGHRILQGRKERRRYSLVGSRRFLGDYLGIGNKGGSGELIRNSINLSGIYSRHVRCRLSLTPSGHERVLFSCRCDLLVTKFGRSSKPSPRIMILVCGTCAWLFYIQCWQIERPLKPYTLWCKRWSTGRYRLRRSGQYQSRPSNSLELQRSRTTGFL